MKISQLVHYRELLDSLRPRDTDSWFHKGTDPVIDLVTNNNQQFPIHLAGLIESKQKIRDGLVEFNDSIDSLDRDLLRMVEALEPSYFANSYQLYEEGQRDSAEYVLNRRFPTTPEVETYIQSRVQAHSDYHFPGMLIRPGLEPWIEHMVACDPLYVVDTHHDLFVPAKEKFNANYQSRLRYYAIKENIEEPMMTALPDGQLGFGLAYNFFHYKPFEIMRKYLQEVYTKLRPGGMFGMTFNDCDRRGAVELAERWNNCYTPGRLVRSLCESVGFVIEQEYVIDSAVNWLELRKPGTMVSLRGGQTLARIIAKSK